MTNEVSVREAVKLTGYSRQQIYNLLIAERIPARKERNVYRIDRRALLEYHRQRRGA